MSGASIGRERQLWYPRPFTGEAPVDDDRNLAKGAIAPRAIILSG